MQRGALVTPPLRLLDVNAALGRMPHDVGGGGVADLLGAMDRLGIDEAVVSHLEGWRHAPAAGNARVVAEVADVPRLHACWIVLPDGTGEFPPPSDLARAAREASVVAVRALPEHHGWLLDSPEGTALGRALADERLPLLVDADQTSWPAVEALTAACPELDVVVCRVGYRSTRTFAPMLDRRPRVRLDLSYLGGHDALEWAVRRFGADRLVFGTGAPHVDPAGPVARLSWSGLDDATAAAIGWGHGAALLGMEVRCG